MNSQQKRSKTRCILVSKKRVGKEVGLFVSVSSHLTMQNIGALDVRFLFRMRSISLYFRQSICFDYLPVSFMA